MVMAMMGRETSRRCYPQLGGIMDLQMGNTTSCEACKNSKNCKNCKNEKNCGKNKCKKCKKTCCNNGFPP